MSRIFRHIYVIWSSTSRQIDSFNCYVIGHYELGWSQRKHNATTDRFTCLKITRA